MWLAASLWQNVCLTARIPASLKSYIILTFSPTSLEQFLWAIWNALSWAIVLTLTQIRLNSQLSRCAFFFSRHLCVKLFYLPLESNLFTGNVQYIQHLAEYHRCYNFLCTKELISYITFGSNFTLNGWFTLEAIFLSKHNGSKYASLKFVDCSTWIVWVAYVRCGQNQNVSWCILLFLCYESILTLYVTYFINLNQTWVLSPTHSKANLLTLGCGEGKCSIY